MACVNPNDPRFLEILQQVGNPLLAEIEFDKLYPEEANDLVNKITNQINMELPAEISDSITVVKDVPLNITGDPGIFFSLKTILNGNGIKDELLINWLGINNNTFKIHPASIRSQKEIEDLLDGVYNKKKKIDSHPALEHNQLAKESFQKWVETLEGYPTAFKEVMLTHAIKYLNPEKREKYVLQLSKVALNQTFEEVMNQPHKLNRAGKIYDKNVIESVSDAVGHEPSESGKGYWVHVPRTEKDELSFYNSLEEWKKDKEKEVKNIEEKIENFPKLQKELDELLSKKPDVFHKQESYITREDADKYGFQDYSFVRAENTYSREKGYAGSPSVWEEPLGENYEGYYIHGYNTKEGKPSTKVVPISKKEAEELWKKEIEREPFFKFNNEDRNRFINIQDKMSIPISELIKNKKELEEEIKNKKWNGNKEYKKNVELLRKLSPSTWCTSGSLTNHYVENFDNYLLIVNGKTVAGIEAYPLDKENDRMRIIKSEIKKLEDKRDNVWFTSRFPDDEYSHGKYYKTKEEAEEFANFANSQLKEHFHKVKRDDTIDLIAINAEIHRLQENLEKLDKEGGQKIKVKEVTSIANNGIAPIDYLDDIIAFFEKHNLDLNNSSLRKAIQLKETGKTDSDVFSEEDVHDYEDYDYYYEGPDPYYEMEDRGDVDDPGLEYRREQEYMNLINVIQDLEVEDVFHALTNRVPVYNYPQYLQPDVLNDERVARELIVSNPHVIAHLQHDTPFYNELALYAVQMSPQVYNYLSEEVKNIPEIKKIYDDYEESNELPFSKTTDNLIQGYYDANNDKVVVVASNTPVKEAAKVGIHEVAHRGMLRMAKELGGEEELFEVLKNSENELMKKLPELLKRTGHTSLEDLMLDYGFNANTREGKFKLLQELAARWAETFTNKPKESWWKEFLTSVRNWIRKFTGHILNEEEVNDLVGGFVKYGTKQSEEQQENVKPIKEGVDEVFESNPELANQVYEALGFTGAISLKSNLKNTGKTEQDLIDYLKKKYPEIKLNITNNPVWEKGKDILNQIIENEMGEEYWRNLYTQKNISNREEFESVKIPTIKNKFKPDFENVYHGTNSYEIDNNGDLILTPSKNFDGKTTSISFTQIPVVAQDYMLRKEGNIIIKINNEALGSNYDIESAEEIAVNGNQLFIVPKGQYEIITVPTLAEKMRRKYANEVEIRAEELINNAKSDLHLIDAIYSERIAADNYSELQEYGDVDISEQAPEWYVPDEYLDSRAAKKVYEDIRSKINKEWVINTLSNVLIEQIKNTGDYIASIEGALNDISTYGGRYDPHQSTLFEELLNEIGLGYFQRSTYLEEGEKLEKAKQKQKEYNELIYSIENLVEKEAEKSVKHYNSPEQVKLREEQRERDKINREITQNLTGGEIDELPFQKIGDRIIGQANIKAMTVLVDAVNKKADTIPHEYAHHYIAWFRNTSIVQEGIKRWGSEEALVQAIGEQVVKQKGEAYNWWKKFTNFILRLLSDKQLLQVLTDSFLNRTDLSSDFTYNQITSQQKQQAQQLYSEYLDTIFPESKVKDIVYHGTDQKLEKFSKGFIGKNENVLGVNGIYVAVNKENAENYARNKNFEKISEGLHSLIINVKNPILVESGEKPFEKLYQLDRQFFNNNYNNAKNLSSKEVTEQLINKNFDSVYNKMNDWQSSYIVFEPEQIHILGNKEDIKGFQEFVVKNKQKETIDNVYVPLSEEHRQLLESARENLNPVEADRVEQMLKGETRFLDDSNFEMC